MIVVQPSPKRLGELKQAILKENNKVYQEIFKAGVIEQQISVIDNKIIILAKHKRIPVLEIIDESGGQLSQLIDRLLIDKFKILLEKSLVDQFGFDVQLILKDYIPTKEVSGTVIILQKDIEEYVTG